MDGTRIKNSTCLIAKTPQFAISYLFAEQENVEKYEMLMRTFPKPNVIVCEGAKSIESAAKQRFGAEIAIQRCFVHINRYVKSRIGKKVDFMPIKKN